MIRIIINRISVQVEGVIGRNWVSAAAVEQTADHSSINNNNKQQKIVFLLIKNKIIKNWKIINILRTRP